jgi:hypothetical protein
MGSSSLTTIVQYVAPVLLGLMGRVVGSLVAPWVQWAIEKRRSRINHRRELVKTWREDVERFTWDKGDFRLTVTYSVV